MKTDEDSGRLVCLAIAVQDRGPFIGKRREWPEAGDLKDTGKEGEEDLYKHESEIVSQGKGGRREETIIDHNERVIDNRSDGLFFKLQTNCPSSEKRGTNERFNCSLLALSGCMFGARTGDQSSETGNKSLIFFLALAVKIDTLALDWRSTCMQ